MKKIFNAILYAMLAIVTLSLKSDAVTPACMVYNGSNVDEQNYFYYHSSLIYSYLTELSDGSFMRVQNGAVSGKILVEYYDTSYNLIKTLLVDEELSDFGGFYSTGSNYYILSGQLNLDEDDSVEVYRITKYDTNWNRLGSDGLYGANTYLPFDAGSARMTSDGDYLLVRTCHEMYKSSDGYHHQANVTFQFDINTMKITDSHTTISGSAGYASHSFNQFIKTDGTSAVAVDHSDAYPGRAIVLFKYTNDFTTGAFSSHRNGDCDFVYMLEFGGNAGDNYTYATLGGFEITDTSYVVAGSSIDLDHTGVYNSSYTTQNIFVSSVSRDLSDNPVITQITNYDEKSESASTPHLVYVSGDKLILIWSHDDKVYYTQLDSYGNQTSSIYSMDASLSDCAPIVTNDGNIIWYTWNFGDIVFYSINTTDLSSTNTTHIHNRHKYIIQNATAGTNVATKICSECGYSYNFTVLSSITVYGKMHSEASYSCLESDIELDVTDSFDLSVRSLCSSLDDCDVDDRSISIISSDCSVVSVSGSMLTANKEGTITLTVQPTYNPYAAKTYTVKVAHNYDSGVITKEPTCTDTGIKTYTCTGCGATKTVSVDKSENHTYGSWTTEKEPTYSETGTKIHSCVHCGYSETQTIDMLTLDTPAVTVSNTANGVNVTWTETTGATGYIVYRRTEDSDWEIINTLSSGSTTSYVDTTAKSGTTYYYTVRATNGSYRSYFTSTSIKHQKRKIIQLSNILQNPELPTGCEVTSLTILLNYLGFNANKLDLTRNYLPKLDFYWKNGIYYGADFKTTFAGNPESKHSYGCYAPCIVTTANKYLKDKSSESLAYDISGLELNTLLTKYIDNDMPVLIWITSSNLHRSTLTSKWTTPQGEKVQWIAYEHCVVLTGYDLDKNLIYVSDPLYNNTSYNYNTLKLRYNELGKQAVCIK